MDHAATAPYSAIRGRHRADLTLRELRKAQVHGFPVDVNLDAAELMPFLGRASMTPVVVTTKTNNSTWVFLATGLETQRLFTTRAGALGFCAFKGGAGGSNEHVLKRETSLAISFTFQQYPMVLRRGRKPRWSFAQIAYPKVASGNGHVLWRNWEYVMKKTSSGREDWSQPSDLPQTHGMFPHRNENIVLHIICFDLSWQYILQGKPS